MESRAKDPDAHRQRTKKDGVARERQDLLTITIQPEKYEESNKEGWPQLQAGHHQFEAFNLIGKDRDNRVDLFNSHDLNNVALRDQLEEVSSLGKPSSNFDWKAFYDRR